LAGHPTLVEELSRVTVVLVERVFREDVAHAVGKAT